MDIQLKWSDPNKTSRHSTQIWRADKPFDTIAEAELIGTVGPGVSTYLDSTVVDKQTYYYRLVFTQPGLASAISKQFIFTAIPYTGPGPIYTQFGDESFGYFGTFPSDPKVIPTFNMIRGIFGLPDNDAVNANASLHKFTIGGTIRGAFQYPIALGTEIDFSNEVLHKLLGGESVTFNLGLHEWSLLLPSTNKKENTTTGITHWPGELRSMLGVMTDLYARVEDADTGNRTGGKIPANQGRVNFFDVLANLYGNTTISYIATSDWVDQITTVIDWTPEITTFPTRPKELHVEDITLNSTNWNKTLVWPILVYSGLTSSRRT